MIFSGRAVDLSASGTLQHRRGDQSPLIAHVPSRASGRYHALRSLPPLQQLRRGSTSPCNPLEAGGSIQQITQMMNNRRRKERRPRLFIIWGDRGDLNPRPPGPQPGALTRLSYGHRDQPNSSTPAKNRRTASARGALRVGENEDGMRGGDPHPVCIDECFEAVRAMDRSACRSPPGSSRPPTSIS